MGRHLLFTSWSSCSRSPPCPCPWWEGAWRGYKLKYYYMTIDNLITNSGSQLCRYLPNVVHHLVWYGDFSIWNAKQLVYRHNLTPASFFCSNRDHHHYNLEDHFDNYDNDRTLKAWGWFRCLRLQSHSHVLPACPKNPRSVNIVIIPALIISWSTIWPNHNDPRWSSQKATMWSYDLMIQDDWFIMITKSHLLRPVPPGHLRHRPSSTSFAPVLIVTIVLEIWGKQ